MREIKFRAWDSAHGMVYQPAFGNMGNGDIILLNELLAVPEQVKLMQYTGLKDNNGKEIYEGDVVKSRFDNGSEVFWDLTSFRLKRRGPEYFDLDFTDIEIIGNIYENPELLDAKQ